MQGLSAEFLLASVLAQNHSPTIRLRKSEPSIFGILRKGGGKIERAVTLVML